jgi:hypothetical protein
LGTATAGAANVTTTPGINVVEHRVEEIVTLYRDSVTTGRNRNVSAE